jgi:hypothetical protein
MQQTANQGRAGAVVHGVACWQITPEHDTDNGAADPSGSPNGRGTIQPLL